MAGGFLSRIFSKSSPKTQCAAYNRIQRKPVSLRVGSTAWQGRLVGLAEGTAAELRVSWKEVSYLPMFQPGVCVLRNAEGTI